MKAILVLAIAAGLLLATAGAASAQHSEQVVFSGAGDGTFGGTDTPFGFWVWCEADSSNAYAGECNGSMYFYALHLVKHVEGGVFEEPDGIYNMSVFSSDGTIACNLHNASAALDHGPHNTVMVDCTAPSGSGSSTNAVVNVTGPED